MPAASKDSRRDKKKTKRDKAEEKLYASKDGEDQEHSEEAVKVRKAYETALESEETLQRHNTSLKDRCKAYFNRAPLCAAKLHAMARFIINSLVASVLKKQKLQNQEVESALTLAMGALQEGWLVMKSMQCAVLLLKLAAASDLNLLQLTSEMRMLLDGAIRTGLKDESWEDFRGQIIEYPDPLNRLHGDVLKGGTFEEQGREMYRLFRECCVVVRHLAQANVPEAHASTKQHSWIEVLAIAVAMDPDLAPLQHNRMAAIVQAKGIELSAEERPRRLVVVGGQVEFAVPEKPDKGVQMVSREEAAKLKSMLLEDLIGKSEKEQEEYSERLLHLSVEDIEEVCKRHEIQGADPEAEVRQLVSDIKAGLPIVIPPDRVELADNIHILKQLETFDLKVPSLPRFCYDYGLVRAGTSPYLDPVPSKVAYRDLTEDPHAWMKTFVQLQKEVMEQRVAAKDQEHGIMLMKLPAFNSDSYSPRHYRDGEESAQVRYFQMIVTETLSKLDLLAEDRDYEPHWVPLDLERAVLSPEFKEARKAKMVMVRQRHTECLLKVLQASEQLSAGGQDPAAIQHICRTIQTCLLSILCKCPDMDDPVTIEDNHDLLSEDAPQDGACKWEADVGDAHVCPFSKEWHAACKSELKILGADMLFRDKHKDWSEQALIDSCMLAINTLAQFELLTSSAVQSLGAMVKFSVTNRLSEHERSTGYELSLAEHIGVMDISWQHLTLLSPLELMTVAAVLFQHFATFVPYLSEQNEMLVLMTLAYRLREKEGVTDDEKHFTECGCNALRISTDRLNLLGMQMKLDAAQMAKQARTGGRLGEAIASEAPPDGNPRSADEAAHCFAAGVVDVLLGDHPLLTPLYGVDCMGPLNDNWIYVLRCLISEAQALEKPMDYVAQQVDAFLNIINLQDQIVEMPDDLSWVEDKYMEVRKLFNLCGNLAKPWQEELQAQDLFALWKEVGECLKHRRPFVGLLDRQLPEFEDFVTSVLALMQQLIQFRCERQVRLDSKGFELRKYLESAVSEYRDSREKRFLRKLGFCLKEKLLKMVRDRQAKESMQLQQELLEEEAREAASAAGASSVAAGKSKKKGDKKRRQAAEKEARRLAEQAALASESQEPLEQSATMDGRPDSAGQSATDSQAEAVEEEGWAHVKGSGKRGKGGGRPSDSSATPSAEPPPAHDGGFREDDGGGEFAKVPGKKARKAKVVGGKAREPPGEPEPPAQQSHDRSQPEVFYDAPEAWSDSTEGHEHGRGDSEWTPIEKPSKHSRRHGPQDATAGAKQPPPRAVPVGAHREVPGVAPAQGPGADGKEDPAGWLEDDVPSGCLLCQSREHDFRNCRKFNSRDAEQQGMLRILRRKFGEQAQRRRRAFQAAQKAAQQGPQQAAPPQPPPSPSTSGTKPANACPMCSSSDHDFKGCPILPEGITVEEAGALRRAKQGGDEDLAEDIVERAYQRQCQPPPSPAKATAAPPGSYAARAGASTKDPSPIARPSPVRKEASSAAEARPRDPANGDPHLPDSLFSSPEGLPASQAQVPWKSEAPAAVHPLRARDSEADGRPSGAGYQPPPATLASHAGRVGAMHAGSQVSDDADDLSDFLSQMGVGPLPSAPEAQAPPGLAHIQAEQEEEDDEELQQALQASLRETTLSAEERYRAGSQVAGGGMQLAVAGSIATPGLQNNVGEYNCFLNCILQCLWNCTELRPAILSWQPHEIQGNAVVAALVDLFRSFATEESQAWRKRERKVVSPAALRKALHSWNEARFQLGEMSDASEVLNAIYESLSMVEEGQKLVKELFEWQVHQNVICESCEKLSHDTHHSQFFYHTSATALRIEAALDHAEFRRGGGMASLGQLLARIEGQTLKTCDKDTGGCGQLLPVVNNLTPPSRPVRVFTLQLGWEKEREESSDIRATMATITETVDAAHVFVGGRPGLYLYSLKSMVSYYGLHYFAFVKDAETGIWRMFDDTTASEVGDWRAVQQKCHLGKIQPSVLFYQADWANRKRRQIEQ